MQYDQLTDEEKRVVDEMMAQLRSGAGTAARLSHTAAQVVESADKTGANAAINRLDPRALVPNETGTRDAVPLSPDDVRALLRIFGDLAQMEKRGGGLLGRACGVGNVPVCQQLEQNTP